MGSDALRPGEGGTGSVITGDGNIAHTQWKVTYRIADIRDYARNVMTDQDDDLVRAATMRGVVEACAEVSVDDLLKQTSQQGDSVTGVARRVAQATLDRMKSGIQIEQLSLVQSTPPLYVRGSFAKVQAAASEAAKNLEAARAYRRTTLTGVAGEAATLLVGEPATPEHPAAPGLIDQYEHEITQGGPDAGEQTLAKIDRVLSDEEVQIGDETRKPGTSGEVTTLILDAKSYKNSVGAEYQAELSRFRAKLAAYQANPSVAIQSEWRDALTQFHKRSNIEVMLLPPGTEWLQLMMSRDPSIRKAVEMSQREAESKKAEQERKAEMEDNKYKTQTNVKEMSSQ
jgi:membrane protease subunit HflK